MQIGRITVINSGMSDYIGRDDKFSPILYFKPTHRNRATLALANYLSHKQFQALNSLATFIPPDEFEAISGRLFDAWLRVAIEQIYDGSIRKIDGYFVTYLTIQEKIKGI